MKKILLSLSAATAFVGLRAQNLDVINNSPCAVNVFAQTFDVAQPCITGGSVGPFLVPAAGSSGPTVVKGINSSFPFRPLPPGWPFPYPANYVWGEANVGIPNPSYGYEYSTTVGDPGIICVPSIPVTTTWFNPTCGYTHTITWTSSPSPMTVPATLVIN